MKAPPVMKTLLSVFLCAAAVQPAASSAEPWSPLLALGKELFYSTALSRDGRISCGSCHLQVNAFADSRRRSRGVFGRLGTRHAPSIAYAYRLAPLFWDGRAPTLLDQVRHPLTGPAEMGLAEGAIPERLGGNTDLMTLHAAVFGDQRPSIHTVSVAIAEYVRSLATFNSEFDRWRRGDGALAPAAQSGMLIFLSKGKCVYCHFNSVDRELFSDMAFHNTGVAYDSGNRRFRDVGRYAITKDPHDLAKFRTPSLRNVAVTAPYFHDGSAKRLKDVIEFYNTGGRNSPGRDLLLTPLHLTSSEKEELIMFLTALTDAEYLQ